MLVNLTGPGVILSLIKGLVASQITQARHSAHAAMLRTLPALQRRVLQRAVLQARCYARDAQRPAVEDILVPDEGLVVLDGYVLDSY